MTELSRTLTVEPGVSIALPAPPKSAFGKEISNWQSLAGIAVLLLILPFLFRMEPRGFDPFLNPNIWVNAIALGVLVTIAAAVVAILASLPVATGFALGRLSPYRWVKWPSVAYIEGFRALPLLILILFVFYSLPRELPLSIERGFAAVAIALTLYTASLNAETLRAGILALDKGQTEAARSLGLSYWQSMRYVILPQAFRNVLPPIVAQFTTLLKDTSLGSIIGMVELLSRGKFIFQTFRNPVETLYVIAILYFILNFILELVSIAIERRRRRERKVAAPNLG